jgi:2-polyprenyl-3-methyl-5-hydroxy-6-metoxy-1,4-benzoquinol methylase
MFAMLKEYTQQSKKQTASLHVLDIGCGSGLVTKKIKELGYQVKGLDFSIEAVNKAIKNGIDAKQCNLDDGIIEESEQFDVVWAGDIIEHVFDPIGLLKEVNRVLKKEGVLITSIPSDVSLNNIIRIILGISYQEQMYRQSGFYKHHTFFTIDLMDFMLKKSHLKREETNKILILPNTRLVVNFFPRALYNEIIFTARKISSC